jgi:hypothetical protein
MRRPRARCGCEVASSIEARAEVVAGKADEAVEHGERKLICIHLQHQICNINSVISLPLTPSVVSL